MNFEEIERQEREEEERLKKLIEERKLIQSDQEMNDEE